MNRKMMLLVIVAVFLALLVLTLVGLQPKKDDNRGEINGTETPSPTTGDISIQDNQAFDNAVSLVAKNDFSGARSECSKINNEESRRICDKYIDDALEDATSLQGGGSSSGQTGSDGCMTSAEAFEFDGTATSAVGGEADKDGNYCWVKFNLSDEVYSSPNGDNIWTSDGKAIFGSPQDGGTKLAYLDVFYNDANGNGKYDDGEDISRLEGTEGSISTGSVLAEFWSQGDLWGMFKLNKDISEFAEYFNMAFVSNGIPTSSGTISGYLAYNIIPEGFEGSVSNTFLVLAGNKLYRLSSTGSFDGKKYKISDQYGNNYEVMVEMMPTETAITTYVGSLSLDDQQYGFEYKTNNYLSDSPNYGPNTLKIGSKKTSRPTIKLENLATIEYDTLLETDGGKGLVVEGSSTTFTLRQGMKMISITYNSGTGDSSALSTLISDGLSMRKNDDIRLNNYEIVSG